ncbi:MAG: dethiobiotin synthase [Betaproteobacteria bacterium]|nr:dethiobiotin synthase [Betaproteobacteria bacterium]
MNRSWFITGTDTGVGKTTVATTLLQCFSRQGYSAVGMKPVGTGCVYEQGLWINDDALLLADHSTLPVSRQAEAVALAQGSIPWQWINPYAYEPPIAPHIAARNAGDGIRFSVIEKALHALQARADVVLVEGAGGFRVPLGADGDTASLCQALGLPVILVVGMRLGCINHALLTEESVKSRGLTLAGWVANVVDPQMQVFEENLATLKQEIQAPFLGLVPFQPDRAAQPPELDIGRLGQ